MAPSTRTAFSSGSLESMVTFTVGAAFPDAIAGMPSGGCGAKLQEDALASNTTYPRTQISSDLTRTPRILDEASVRMHPFPTTDKNRHI
jgi:hypothetical protein